MFILIAGLYLSIVKYKKPKMIKNIPSNDFRKSIFFKCPQIHKTQLECPIDCIFQAIEVKLFLPH